MGKETIFSKAMDKMKSADKTDGVHDELWEIYREEYGAILELAFVKKPALKKKLCVVVKNIHEDNLIQALQQLDNLKTDCNKDADRASVLFFIGLVYEKAGESDNATEQWLEAASYQQPYCLLDLKLAKAAFKDGMYEIAGEFYKKALKAFDRYQAGNSGKETEMKNEIYKGMIDCQIVTHRYKEAKKTLMSAGSFLSKQENAQKWCILNALDKNQEKLEANLAILKESSEDVYEKIKKETTEILENRHIHYCKREIQPKLYEKFWEWFLTSETELVTLLAGEHSVRALEMIQEKLYEIFSFMERDMEMGIEIKNAQCLIDVSDFYSCSMNEGLKNLLEVQPEALKEHWVWTIIHE